jgi:excisionase family DNA binding protein
MHGQRALTRPSPQNGTSPPTTRPGEFEESHGDQANTSARKPVASVRPSDFVKTPSAKPVLAFEPLLDLHEAAEVLGMHWKTLEAKARGHEVPAFKVGKRWRFRLSSLNRWLEDGINSNTTDQAVLTR